MSEYQFVHFLAVDQPLDDEQLEYMESQSSRAEISRWGFTNEYHFGDFRGRATEMLRRGYDVHLHYANFGIRKLMFRLPRGLPCEEKQFAAYHPEFGLSWHADKSANGGILEIQPDADAGTYCELFDVGDMLPAIAPVRELLISGDLRPLYLCWLVCVGDEDAAEPPVPAGLEALPECLVELARFYELSEDLIAAAVEGTQPVPATRDEIAELTTWLKKQSSREVRNLAAQLLSKDSANVRAKTLTLIREATTREDWPVSKSTRTLGELRARAAQLEGERVRKEEQAAAAARKRQLAKIAADPQVAIAEAERLVATRSTANYSLAAQQLADLREALGAESGPAKARQAAERIRQNNPKRSGLVAALKKHNLLTGARK